MCRDSDSKEKLHWKCAEEDCGAVSELKPHGTEDSGGELQVFAEIFIEANMWSSDFNDFESSCET